MAEYILTVGTGKTYADIAAAWAALPSTIASGDVYRIQLAAQTFSAAFTAGSKTVSGDIIIEPEAGAAWYEANDYSTNALSDSVSGCAQIIGGQSLSGVWKFPSMGGTISVRGLAFRATGGRYALEFVGGTANIERCLLVSEAGSEGVLKLGGMNGTIKNNVLIKLSANTTLGAVAGIDTNSKTVWFDNNLIIAPTARAESWLVATYGAGMRFRNNAVFGFQIEPPSARFHADSGYNATDLSAHPGTNNLLSLSAANQYVSPSSPLDLRLKAGSVLIDGGMDSGVAIDFTGAARTLPYSIGPQEALFSTGGDTTAPTLTSPTASATGSTTASGSVSTNEANGTLYYLASANATELVATVKAGSSQAVTANGAQSVSFTGLTASTPYYPHYLHRDAAGNDSAVATGAQFTTSAAGDTTVPTLTGSVTFASITQTSYTANWPAGSDNVAVTGYEYQIGSTAGAWTNAGNNLSAAITGRTAGTTETVYVRAYDAAGLRSTPAISGAVTLLSVVAGISVTEPLKNNTGTVLASQSGVRVAALQAADLVSVYEVTGLTTNASGILSTISDAAITAGQQYHVAIKLADGSVGITGPITAS